MPRYDNARRFGGGLAVQRHVGSQKVVVGRRVFHSVVGDRNALAAGAVVQSRVAACPSLRGRARRGRRLRLAWEFGLSYCCPHREAPLKKLDGSGILGSGCSVAPSCVGCPVEVLRRIQYRIRSDHAAPIRWPRRSCPVGVVPCDTWRLPPAILGSR